MPSLRELLEDARTLLDDPDRPLIAGKDEGATVSNFYCAVGPCHCSVTALDTAFENKCYRTPDGAWIDDQADMDRTAIEKLDNDLYAHFREVNEIPADVNGDSSAIIEWNDALGRTVGEVREAFDRAIEAAA